MARFKTFLLDGFDNVDDFLDGAEQQIQDPVVAAQIAAARQQLVVLRGMIEEKMT